MNTFEQSKIKEVQKILQEASSVMIVAHRSPDGDSIGSSVGMYHYLKNKGITTQICHPDPAPYFLKWMNGVDTILNFEENKDQTTAAINNADVLFCLDFNTMSRTGQLSELMLASSAKKMVIDHHLHPNLDEFDIVFSEPSACSTAQLVADFIYSMGDEKRLNKEIGEALYCGIMTDTGSFRFPNVAAHTHEIIAQLMQHGVEPYKIHEAVFDTNTVDKLRLRSYAINEKMEIVPQHKTAIISLNKEELSRFHYVKGDTEGLVNVGLSIMGITKSVFLMEHDGIIKISFRSKGTHNPVNEMAEKYFKGGGHANASGGKWEGSMIEAIEEVKKRIPEFDEGNV